MTGGRWAWKACLYEARVMLDLARARVAARQLALEPQLLEILPWLVSTQARRPYCKERPR